MNRISIIIPTFQHASTIGLCIDSMLKQTRQPDEIIVVDDGSTDNTKEILYPYLSRITYLYQENAGPQFARMKGFEASIGDCVMFCDADVVATPNMLEKLQLALVSHPEASYAYSRFMWGSKLFKSKPFSAQALRDMNFIHTSALIRREHFPGFDTNIKRFQDWDVWLTMLEQGYIGIFVPEILFSIVLDHSRVVISKWLPSFVYKLPWEMFKWTPKMIREYFRAKEIIKRKHHL